MGNSADIFRARQRGTLEPACIPLIGADGHAVNKSEPDGSIVSALKSGFDDITGITCHVVVDADVGKCEQDATILGIKDRRLIIDIGGDAYGVTLTKTKVYVITDTTEDTNDTTSE